jgi:hypothetical protein
VGFWLVTALGARASCEEVPRGSEVVRFDPPFEWSAPAGCPSRALVLETLSQSLVLDSASWNHVDRVQGRVNAKPGGWQLTLEFQHGQRVLRRAFVTRDCADLAQAAAASLALVLDPGWDWAPEPTPAEKPEPASATAGVGDRSPSPSPVALAGLRGTGQIRFAVGADGVLDATTFGREALGISVRGRANWEGLGPPFSAELFGTWLPDRRIAVRAGEGVELGLLTGGARGCWSAQVELGFCAELELGRLSASGVGLEIGRTSRDVWAAPGASVLLSSIPIGGRVSLNARVALLAPLVRPRYFVDQTEAIHDVPGYVLRVSLGATLPVF